MARVVASSARTRAAVASGHPDVTAAALELIDAGGNAVDAAIAAGFAAAVAEPALTSLGGGGFLLARSADGHAGVYDFFVDTPGRGLPPSERELHFVPVTVRFSGGEQEFNVGLGSVAVPGNLRGFLHAHAREGRLPLRDVIAPARRLARDGVIVNAHQAHFLGLLEPILALTPAARALYLPAGHTPAEGDRLRNPDLASFLEELPKDAGRDFYAGALARRIAQDLHEGQGLVTQQDLAAYSVQERRPLEATYRNHRLLTNPAPSFGGGLLALSLRLLERAGPAAAAFASAEHVGHLAAVMAEVHRLREDGKLTPDAADGEDVVGRLRASRGTTHVSVQDPDGGVASLTTSNGEGSGYVVPGTGIQLNNMLGEDDLHPDGFHSQPAGERVASMMAPSVLLRGDRVRAVLGSGGSKRIRTALLQVITAVADFDLPLDDAVEQPRLHWDGEALQVEPGLGAETMARLHEAYPVIEWPQRDLYFGGVHAVGGDGSCVGDPRRGGHAASRDVGVSG